MKVSVKITKNFRKEAKGLFKKYQSLPDDLAKLESELISNPKLGISLGYNAYKRQCGQNRLVKSDNH